MQPHDEQPDENHLDQPMLSPLAGNSQLNSQPVVTLSPEESQAMPAVQPASEPVQGSSPGKNQAGDLPLHWQAAEYVHRERDQIWYIVFAFVTLILICVAIFIIKSFTFAILVPVMAAAMVVYVRRPPVVLDYTLSRQGLHINDKLFPFAEFKSFALVHGGTEFSVMLIPTKRFKPGVSMYFPENVGESVIDMLAARLPMQDTTLDIVDRIIHKLHL